MHQDKRAKSIGRIKTKQILPNVKKRERTMIEELKTSFIPYSFKSYKEKFGSKYIKLGGLGANLENTNWNFAMDKKRKMNMVSRSIDFQNKQKYASLSSDDTLKKTIKDAASELINSIYSLKKIKNEPVNYEYNEYLLKKMEGKFRREKSLSYAETIKKPIIKQSFAIESSLDGDRLHDPSPQSHLLQRQIAKMFEN